MNTEHPTTTDVITDFDVENQCIRQTVTIGKCAVQFILDTREPIIHEALMAIGWQPPTRIVTPKPKLTPIK